MHRGRLHVAHPEKHLGHLSFYRKVDILRNVARDLGDAESIEFLDYDTEKSATLVEQGATAVTGDLQFLQVLIDAGSAATWHLFPFETTRDGRNTPKDAMSRDEGCRSFPAVSFVHRYWT